MEQSPLPAVEPSPENLRQAQEQKARLQVSTGLILGGRKTLPATVPISPVSSDSHFGLGERVRLLLTVVTATSCRAGEGEVRSKTSRTAGKDHGESTLDMRR